MCHACNPEDVGAAEERGECPECHDDGDSCALCSAEGGED